MEYAGAIAPYTRGSANYQRDYVAHYQKTAPYRSLRVHALLNQQGIRCGHNQLVRLMRIADVRATAQRRRFRYPAITKTEAKKFSNLVNRQFTVHTPNTMWLTDITFINIRSQPMHLATMLDLYSRRYEVGSRK